MYHIPSDKGVSKIVIDEACINGESEPIKIYENNDKAAKALPEK
jgi:ATP-dependent Clp protease ATP-binding subunit ClpX